MHILQQNTKPVQNGCLHRQIQKTNKNIVPALMRRHKNKALYTKAVHAQNIIINDYMYVIPIYCTLSHKTPCFQFKKKPLRIFFFQTRVS